MQRLLNRAAWDDTAGRVENCQLGVFLAYASPKGRALVDRELYLPKSWTDDRDRCRGAGVPDDVEFASKTELAHLMLGRALDAGMPAARVTAGEAYGEEGSFRGWLEQRRTGYVVAVPKSKAVAGDAGKSRADVLTAHAPDQAWKRRSCGNGAKGPRVCDWAAATVPEDGTERSAPRARRTRPAWTTTRSAATTPGTAMPPSPSWRTPTSPSPRPGSRAGAPARTAGYSRLSEIARDGTANDRRKIGRMFFPLNRKAMTWSSSASKAAVRLEFRRPLRICRVWRPGSTGVSKVPCFSTVPARLPSTTTSNVPRRTSAPITLCATLSVAGTLGLLCVECWDWPAL